MTYYGSPAGFANYHNSRQNDISDFDDEEEIEAALLVSSEWIDNRYRMSFGGTKVGLRDQVREWPRDGALDIYGYPVSSETVPHEVEHATYEVALRHLKQPGILSLDFTPNKYQQVSVDGAVSVTFANFGSYSEIQTQFAIVNEILSALLDSRRMGSRLSGEAIRV